MQHLPGEDFDVVKLVDVARCSNVIITSIDHLKQKKETKRKQDKPHTARKGGSKKKKTHPPNKPELDLDREMDFYASNDFSGRKRCQRADCEGT